MVNTVTEVITVGISLNVIAWFFVLLRCFTRVKIVKSFGLDDWLIVVSIVSLKAQKHRYLHF